MQQLTLGQRIAAHRKLSGLSQEALAEQMDVSRQAVSKWESDITIPEIDKLIALSKLFEVSVGYLLGAEKDPDNASNLSDQQLKTIEELISKYHTPKRISWWKITISSILFVIVLSLFIYYNHQIQLLGNSNEEAASQITILSDHNSKLQNKLDELTELLTAKAEEDQLISEYQVAAYTDDTKENVTLLLYLKPNVYLESNTAYIFVQNSETGYSKSFPCTRYPYSQMYTVRYTIPAEDGYKVTFRLVNAYGYEEENLSLRDMGFSHPKTYCNFYIDPSNSQYTRMQRQEPFFLKDSYDMESEPYVYNIPIYSPHIFAQTAVGYQDIRICMLLNGEIIWEKSYLQEFYKAADGIHLNAKNTPIMPDISISLPDLVAGDALELVLTAETVNGGAKTQSYNTLLDYIKIVE